MRDEPTGFHREDKARRRQLPPALKGFLFGETVKAVVDLNRIEFARIPREHFGRREPLRVEISQPVLIMPARRADVDHAFGEHIYRERLERVRAALRAARERLEEERRRAADLA